MSFCCHSAKCHSDKRHSAKCHSDKRHSAKCHSDKRHSAKCHFVECHSAKCHPADCHSAEYHSLYHHSFVILRLIPSVIQLNIILLNGTGPRCRELCFTHVQSNIITIIDVNEVLRKFLWF